MKKLKYIVHSATWVKGDKKVTMRAEDNNPVITDNIEKFRADMQGRADQLYLTYTTYES